MRRTNDFYQTPQFMTRALLDQVPEISGQILEPCAGDLSIARVLREEGGLSVVTNDLDPAQPTDLHESADDVMLLIGTRPDWIVTNPPYSMPLCLRIIEASIEFAAVGVAMMLRISFKEPTKLRGPFLAANPISRELVMPRYSFTQNGKSDSATTAWMIWSHVPLRGHPMVSIYGAEETYAGSRFTRFVEADVEQPAS